MTNPVNRRRFLALTAFGLASTGLSGCSLFGIETGPAAAVPPDPAPSVPASAGTTPSGATRSGSAPQVRRSRALVAYLSVPETDDPEGMTQDEENSTHVVDGQVLGNTQYVAQLVSARLGADLFRIETAQELPLDHDTLEELALRWQEAGTRPELKTLIPDLDQYETVFVGYPIWWYDLPMPLHTFFEQQDFSGKNIVLFTTHGGNRLSGTVEKITGMLPAATVATNAFTISRDDMDQAPAEVTSWLDTFES